MYHSVLVHQSHAPLVLVHLLCITPYSRISRASLCTRAPISCTSTLVHHQSRASLHTRAPLVNYSIIVHLYSRAPISCTTLTFAHSRRHSEIYCVPTQVYGHPLCVPTQEAMLIIAVELLAATHVRSRRPTQETTPPVMWRPFHFTSVIAVIYIQAISPLVFSLITTVIQFSPQPTCLLRVLNNLL